MAAAPTTLSLVAAGIYLLVAGCAALASWRALSHRQIAWHRWGWSIIAALFVGLAVVRIFAVEELLRADLRIALQYEGAYDRRRAIQGPLFVLVFALASAAIAGLLHLFVKGVRGRRNIASLIAIGCTGGMFFLLAVRLVSLHSVDQLLYGPYRLNWIADLGLSFSVLASALRYQSVVRVASG